MTDTAIKPLLSAQDVAEFEVLARCTCERFNGLSKAEKKQISVRKAINELVLSFMNGRGFKVEVGKDRRGKEYLRAADERTEEAAKQLQVSVHFSF